MQTVRTLTLAARLVELGHCKFTIARDHNEQPCDPLSPLARTFSVYGALINMSSRFPTPDEQRADLARATHFTLLAGDFADLHELAAWNDHPDRTPSDANALLRQAAALYLRAAYPTDAASLLLFYAAHLVERGHCQGFLAVDDMCEDTPPNSFFAIRFSLRGAIMAAAQLLGDDGKAALDRLFTFASFRNIRAADAWNDAHGRTAAEVATLLRRAARVT